MSTVLIVDDSEDSRSFCEMIARMFHLNVRNAGDVDEAIEVLEGGAKPNLILLDLMMPGRDPQVLIDYVKNDVSLADTKVVLMSALRETHERAQTMGADNSLTKPLDLNALIGQLKLYSKAQVAKGSNAELTA